MPATLLLVVYMAVLTWLTLLAASVLRTRAWTLSGTMIALGNRDNLPEATPLAARAERTARNTLENFILFAAIALVAQAKQFAAGAGNPLVDGGAEIFFWSRVLYIPVYYAGVIYLRTAFWLVSVVGLATMIFAVLYR